MGKHDKPKPPKREKVTLDGKVDTPLQRRRQRNTPVGPKLTSKDKK